MTRKHYLPNPRSINTQPVNAFKNAFQRFALVSTVGCTTARTEQAPLEGALNGLQRWYLWNGYLPKNADLIKASAACKKANSTNKTFNIKSGISGAHLKLRRPIADFPSDKKFRMLFCYVICIYYLCWGVFVFFLGLFLQKRVSVLDFWKKKKKPSLI